MTPKKRSLLMSHIRGKNTKPELVLRKTLWSIGFRYRINDPSVTGKPDLSSKKMMISIFVDGCFWHGCPNHGTIPMTHRKYWHRKILKNKARDLFVDRILERAGWIVIRIWEHEIEHDLDHLILRLQYQFRKVAHMRKSTNNKIKKLDE